MKSKLVLMALLCAGSAFAQQPQPPQVGVIIAKKQTVNLTENLPARLEASEEALIYPQIAGIVEKRLFKEGSFVEAGQALYQIDDAMHQANLQSAKARLVQAEASKGLAQTTANRYAPLVKEQAVSKQAYDQALAEVKVADANILSAKANIKQAQISLDYAKVYAPISGVISRSYVTTGTLVNSSVQMAKIQQLDPMYVNIRQSANQLLKLKKAFKKGQGANSSEIQIYFEDGSAYPHKGQLLFAEQTVDETTGEILIRAKVPNPDGDLLPNLYVRVDVPQEHFEGVYLVPQRAVVRGAVDKLNIVASDGTYSSRAVKIIGASGNNWVINEGLNEGEMVMVDTLSMLLQASPVVTPVVQE